MREISTRKLHTAGNAGGVSGCKQMTIDKVLEVREKLELVHKCVTHSRDGEKMALW